MAKVKEEPVPLGKTETFYVPVTLKPNLNRLDKLCDRYHLSRGFVINLLIDACLETLEREVPIHRSFTLNGKEVVL